MMQSFFTLRRTWHKVLYQVEMILQNMGSNSRALQLAGFLLAIFFTYQTTYNKQPDVHGNSINFIMAFIGMFLGCIGGFLENGSTIIKNLSLLGAIGSLFAIILFGMTLLSLP
jgi:hypothetical protein